MLKKIIEISFWIVLSVGLFILLSFAETTHKSKSCNGIEVYIDYQNTDTLIYAEEILNIVKKTDDSIINRPIKTINYSKIKSAIERNNAIINSNIYTDLEGKLKIHLSQRKPVIKIFNNTQTLYIDENGIAFLAGYGCAAHVIIANGNIKSLDLGRNGKVSLDTIQEFDTYKNLLLLSKAIRKDKFLKSMIDQIYITPDQECELIPKIGKHVVLFGDFNNMDEKLIKLKAFYEGCLPASGWNKYKTINLKFKDQIVCSKIK